MTAPLIWHITELPLWEQASRVGTFTIATRGRELDEVGYIHASMPEQISSVARRVYPERPENLVILEISVELLEQAGVSVEFETGSDGDDAEQIYPHILGPVPVSAVVRVRSTKWVGKEFVVVA